MVTRRETEAEEMSDVHTVLFEATQSGDAAAVERILSIPGVVVNLQWPHMKKRTALHIACDEGFENVVAALLQHRDIDVNLEDEDGQSPIDLAWRNGIKARLLQHGAKDKHTRKVEKEMQRALKTAQLLEAQRVQREREEAEREAQRKRDEAERQVRREKLEAERRALEAKRDREDPGWRQREQAERQREQAERKRAEVERKEREAQTEAFNAKMRLYFIAGGMSLFCIGCLISLIVAVSQPPAEYGSDSWSDRWDGYSDSWSDSSDFWRDWRRGRNEWWSDNDCWRQ